MDAPREKITAIDEVVDSQGITLKLDKKPQHIVSLTLCSDEILFSLIDKSRFASCSSRVTDLGISNIAENAQELPQLSSKSVEAIIALQPDLVIAADWLPVELIDSLREVGLNVYVYQTPSTITEVKALIAEFSKVVGETEKGIAIVKEMDEVLEKVQADVKQIPQDKRKVVMALSFMGCYGGKGSILDDIDKNAGVINGATLAGLEKNDTLAKEQLIAINPDVIMVPTWDYEGKDTEQFKQDILNDPALATVKAVKNKQLIQVADKYTYCTSQYVVYGVRDLAKAVYQQ
jgi:iron complex transport system substrate-binding protein